MSSSDHMRMLVLCHQCILKMLSHNDSLTGSLRKLPSRVMPFMYPCHTSRPTPRLGISRRQVHSGYQYSKERSIFSIYPHFIITVCFPFFPFLLDLAVPSTPASPSSPFVGAFGLATSPGEAPPDQGLAAEVELLFHLTAP